MSDDFISIDCLEIEQPIGTFYLGVMDAGDVLRISYADVRKISRRDVEKYLGIERPLNPKRVEEIKKYVKTVDATFPTAVILAVSSEDAQYSRGRMRIRNDEKVAQIIDGQHRLAGLRGFTERVFQINVVIFVDMDIEDQAMVFATINLAQTKVSKSLAYDLYEYTKSRSPTKTCHNIARLLNLRQESPFYDRIKILGRATRPYQPLTQASFVEALLHLMSDDPLGDRDELKRGKTPKRASPTEKRMVFRNMFIDKKDAQIAKVIWNYCSAVAYRWPIGWQGVDIPGNVLPRTTGFRALMRFLPLVYLTVGRPGSVPSESTFSDIFERIPLQDTDFTVENYKPGGTGERALLTDFEGYLSRIDLS